MVNPNYSGYEGHGACSWYLSPAIPMDNTLRCGESEIEGAVVCYQHESGYCGHECPWGQPQHGEG